MLYRQLAGCVVGYFADCTVVMPLFLLIAILRNVGVGMLRFERSSKGVALTGGLTLAEEPTFHNVFRLPVNKSVPKNKVTLH